MLAELYGCGTTGPGWHDATRRAIPLVMLSNLNTEVPSRVQDKRLQIELDAIRQSIFGGDGRRTAEVYPRGGDCVDWVATATQIADCLTERTCSKFWIHAGTSGHCAYRAGRARVGPDRVCSRRIGNGRSNERQDN